MAGSWGLGCVLPPKRCLHKTLAPTFEIPGYVPDWCSVVNKLVWLKYVDNSKRRFHLYQSTVTQNRTEQNLFVRIG